MNRNLGKLTDGKLTYAPSTIWDGDTCYCNPTAEQYAAAGYLRVIDERPAERVGVYFTPSGWAIEDGVIRRRYAERQVVAPTPQYSVEEIIYGLIEAGALQAVKQIVGDYWELFTMRETVAADNEIWAAKFPALRAAIVASGALDEAQIDAILKGAEV